VVAGVFFAFSAFVMKALGRLPDKQGLAAMQAVNVEAVTPAFMTAFLGTAVVCAVLAVYSLVVWGEGFAPYVLVGGLVYLGGALLVTIFYNVPRNEALARVEPQDSDADKHWRRYLSSWTAGNHVRTVASLMAAALFTVALCIG